MVTDIKSDFDEFMRGSRVFILGAGFSAAAGIPLTSTLLRDAMSIFKKECNGIFQRVDGYAQDLEWRTEGEIDYAKFSFSELCTHLEFVELSEYAGGERWSNEGSREKLALRFYLAKCIAKSTPPPHLIPNLYIEFAKQLSDRDVVISFNWDGLLELALLQAGKRFSYNFGATGISLAKPHGSINWRLNEPRNLRGPANTLGWEAIGFAKGFIEQEIWHTNALLDRSIWDYYNPLGEVQPFLVLPGYGKAFDVRSNATLWYRPGFAFVASRDIYIIGLGLAPDDHFVRSFFLNCFPVQGKHLYIINPDKMAPENYAFALQGQDSHLLNEAFSMDHVALMKRRLEID